jgi:ketosteroid isomerase-like protein
MSVDIDQLDQDLNQRILEGDILNAFEEFYAEDVVMEEGDDRRVGKDENREYEKGFVDSLEEFHSAEIKARAVDHENNVTFSEWHNEMTLEGVGRVEQKQVAVRTWNEDGQITNEKFYQIG